MELVGFGNGAAMNFAKKPSTVLKITNIANKILHFLHNQNRTVALTIKILSVTTYSFYIFYLLC